MTNPSEEFENLYQAIGEDLPNTDQYQYLGKLTLEHGLVSQLNGLDPFSDTYRDLAMELYLDLRGNDVENYDPERDEMTEDKAQRHNFCNISPWSFKDTSFVSEFLFSWGNILKSLNLKANEPAKIIEYGAGSGQLLLMLAKMGNETYAVDINPDALSSINYQANALELSVFTEKAVFGEGFEGKRFDRIIFFEAFHHAFQFMDLLDNLHDRLEPNGKVIFAGEPISEIKTGAIPYPWGPRLDGLSVYCMRRFGWMELGFTHEFFMEVLRKKSWRCQVHSFPGCGRANVYVAQPLTEDQRKGRYLINLGDNCSSQFINSDEWGPPEGSHRWTIKEIVKVDLLHTNVDDVDIILHLANYLLVDKEVIITVGDKVAKEIIPSGTSKQEITLKKTRGNRLSIETKLTRPSEDDRLLGIALLSIKSSS